MPSRSFDIKITKMDDAELNFMSIDKEEQKNLLSYFKAKNIKMRAVDLETN